MKLAGKVSVPLARLIVITRASMRQGDCNVNPVTLYGVRYILMREPEKVAQNPVALS
jgi:hypothetical protein